MACQETPQAGKAQRIEKVEKVDVALAVTFAREGEHRIGASLDAAVNQARKMDAEKRKLRIRDGVNQIAHQELPLRLDLVILAPKGNDPHVRLFSGQSADP